MIKIYTRARWGARPPRSLSQDGPKLEAFLHHSAGTFSGPAEAIDTGAEQKEVMRRIQNYHMDVNGWSDIGYHFVVFQPYGRLRLARIFQGRPVTAIPAAQLGHNSGTIAICVVDGLKGNKLRLSTKFQIIRLLRKLKKKNPTLRVLGGHFNVTSTSCPGPYIKPAIPSIAARAGLKVYS